MFILKEGNVVKRFSTYHFNGAEETNQKIVEGFDHKYYLEEYTKTKEYLSAKKEYDEKFLKGVDILKKKARLEELTKDLAQVQAGLIIENIEEKKEEFRTLLNEIRVLQGKEPREIVSRETI